MESLIIFRLQTFPLRVPAENFKQSETVALFCDNVDRLLVLDVRCIYDRNLVAYFLHHYIMTNWQLVPI